MGNPAMQLRGGGGEHVARTEQYHASVYLILSDSMRGLPIIQRSRDSRNMLEDVLGLMKYTCRRWFSLSESVVAIQKATHLLPLKGSFNHSRCRASCPAHTQWRATVNLSMTVVGCVIRVASLVLSAHLAMRSTTFKVNKCTWHWSPAPGSCRRGCESDDPHNSANLMILISSLILSLAMMLPVV